MHPEVTPRPARAPMGEVTVLTPCPDAGRACRRLGASRLHPGHRRGGPPIRLFDGGRAFAYVPPVPRIRAAVPIRGGIVNGTCAPHHIRRARPGQTGRI